MDKAPDAFRTISEVADELRIPQHVLRFWESKFSQIRPMKRAGGRRYYRPDDVDLLRGIRHLLYTECYRIEGVQGILREQGPKFVQNVWRPGGGDLLAAVASDEGADPDQQLAPDEAARALFGLLKSPEREPVAETPALEPNATAMPSGDPVISREDARRLQAALHELSECRRLIDEALRDEAA